MQKNKIVIFVVILFIHLSSKAQYTDVINSNRPGVSESAFSVGTNVLQFEAGAFTVDEEHNLLQNEVSGYGLDFSVRYGLFFEQLEISVDGIYQNDTFTDLSPRAIPGNEDADRSNFRNFTVGAKYLVFDPYKNREDKPNLYSYHANFKFKWRDLIPAVAVYAGANFDSDPNPYTANGVKGLSPKVMVATQNNFKGGWVFVTNFILDRIGTDQSDFSYVITLTHSFDPQWVVFAETQGINSDFYADNLFRFGGAYLWNKDFQIDTNITFNTKDTPSVLSFNLGASYRLDFHKDKIDNKNSAEDEAKRQSKKERKGKKSKNKKKKKKEKTTDFDLDSSSY